MDKLSKVQEGSGTLLDNTILYWGNGLAHGGNHTQNDVPFVLAGGGGFKYGRYLKYGDPGEGDGWRGSQSRGAAHRASALRAGARRFDGPDDPTAGSVPRSPCRRVAI